MKDIAPVTLLDVEMKSMVVFLFASILDLLAMERSIAVHLTHLTGSGEMFKKNEAFLALTGTLFVYVTEWFPA